MTEAPADYLAIDADGHVHEEDAMFHEYLEPAFRARTRGWALNADRNRRFVVDGGEHPPFPKEISVRKPMPPDSRIKVLDKERIRLARDRSSLPSWSAQADHDGGWRDRSGTRHGEVAVAGKKVAAFQGWQRKVLYETFFS